MLGVSISTVSRTIRGKYLQCARGVFPLDYFFCRSVIGTNSENISAYHAKQALKALIDGEDPKAPLSDRQIAERLQTDGMDISRRTIAKYREELHIPNTAGRRAIGSGEN